LFIWGWVTYSKAFNTFIWGMNMRNYHLFWFSPDFFQQEKNSIDILTATLDRDGFVLERAAPWTSTRIDQSLGLLECSQAKWKMELQYIIYPIRQSFTDRPLFWGKPYQFFWGRVEQRFIVNLQNG
jgi:hypothetical protein